MGLHEFLRDCLVDTYGLSHITGEISGYALLGTLILSAWLTGIWSLKQQSTKALKLYLLFSVYYGLLIFFGIGVDQIHEWLSSNTRIPETIMALAEDGMEQFIITLTAITTLGLWCAERHKLQRQT